MPNKTIDEINSNVKATTDERILSGILLEELQTNPGPAGDTPLIPNSSEKAIRLPLSVLFPGASKVPNKTNNLEDGPTQEQATLNALRGIDPPGETREQTEILNTKKKKFQFPAFFSHSDKKNILPKKEVDPGTVEARIKTINNNEFLIIKINKQALYMLVGLLLILIGIITY
jgi:hypothetical protein